MPPLHSPTFPNGHLCRRGTTSSWLWLRGPARYSHSAPWRSSPSHNLLCYTLSALSLAILDSSCHIVQLSGHLMLLSLTAFGGVLLVSYLIALSFYRLVFSPLAKFPGPKLAALSLWYEYYYDVVKRGQYTFKIKEMHEKYGKCHPRSGTASLVTFSSSTCRPNRSHKSARAAHLRSRLSPRTLHRWRKTS